MAEMNNNDVKENNATNDIPENQDNNGGVQNPPAVDGEKKENPIVKFGKGVVKFGKEKVVPGLKKAKPYVIGATVATAVIGGAIVKKGYDDMKKESEKKDDKDEFDLDDDIDVIDFDPIADDEDEKKETEEE